MRVFISSTAEDLADYRKVVEQAVLDAQWLPVGMEHFPNDPRPILQLCKEEVAKCAVVILIQAFRRGWVPDAAKGGDGTTSVTGWEIQAADERKIDVVAFLSDDNWPVRLSERDAGARQWVDAFRDGLNRNAKFFAWEAGVPTQFRSLVRESLALHRDRIAGAAAAGAHRRPRSNLGGCLPSRRNCPRNRTLSWGRMRIRGCLRAAK